MTPDQILEELGETYREKEEDYSEAWKIVPQMMYLMAGEDPVEVSSYEEWVWIGLYYERLIKIVRAFHGEFVIEDDPNYEDIRDSHQDDAVYATMHASTHQEEES